MRKEFPAKVRKTVFLRANGKCEKCAAVLKKGEGEVDHILPCALGGEATAANAQLICRVCHAAKTAIDVSGIRKADRRRNLDVGIKRPSGKLKSAGFPKPDKPERAKTALPPRAIYRAINGER